MTIDELRRQIIELQNDLIKQAREEGQLIGAAKVLDDLWDNSYYALGKETAERIRKEMTYYFGDDWAKTMYDFMLRDGESLHGCRPVPIKTLAELEKAEQ